MPPRLCSLYSVAAVLQDLVLDKEASQTSQVERENLMSLFLLNFAVAAPLGKNKSSILLHLYNSTKFTLLSCSILTHKHTIHSKDPVAITFYHMLFAL